MLVEGEPPPPPPRGLGPVAEASGAPLLPTPPPRTPSMPGDSSLVGPPGGYPRGPPLLSTPLPRSEEAASKPPFAAAAPEANLTGAPPPPPRRPKDGGSAPPPPPRMPLPGGENAPMDGAGIGGGVPPPPPPRKISRGAQPGGSAPGKQAMIRFFILESVVLAFHCRPSAAHKCGAFSLCMKCVRRECLFVFLVL